MIIDGVSLRWSTNQVGCKQDTITGIGVPFKHSEILSNSVYMSNESTQHLTIYIDIHILDIIRTHYHLFQWMQRDFVTHDNIRTMMVWVKPEREL